MFAAIAIIVILMALIFPSFKSIIPKAQEIVCISHLRGLWMGFAPCCADGTGWPQLPPEIQIGSRAEEQWWLDTSSNLYGISAGTWICPTMTHLMGSPVQNSSTSNIPLIDYMPTLFDNKPMTPNQWPTMPWFMEIGNVHGHGNLMIRPDGSVVPAPTPAF